MGNYDFILDLKTKNTMSIINNWINENTTVLEFGPANGRLTKYLKEVKQCSVSIVEIDELAGKEAAQYANESFIGPIYGNIENWYWKKNDKCFDYIIFADVLEHLSNPKEVLRQCCQVLKENGNILISIPNVAHNSILIDLYNEQFNYDKTGLLDQTHIHFFTHKSFMKMLDDLELYAYQIEVIYSRVGNNEIENSYEDVPAEVSVSLRKRKAGSVYQYVYKLGKDKNRESKQIKYEEIDKYEDQESTCFWLNDMSRIATRKASVSQIYQGKFENVLVFDFPEKEKVKEIRWDPMEHSCVISIKGITAELTDGSHLELECSNSNAAYTLDRNYIFHDKDPQIWLSANDKQKTISKVLIHFYILKYNLEKISDYQMIFKCMEPCIKKFLNLEQQEMVYLKTISQLYIDVNQREKDIDDLKRSCQDNYDKYKELSYEKNNLDLKCKRLEEKNAEFGRKEEELKEHIKKLDLNLVNTISELQCITTELEIYKHPFKHFIKYLKRKKGSK